MQLGCDCRGIDPPKERKLDLRGLENKIGAGRECYRDQLTAGCYTRMAHPAVQMNALPLYGKTLICGKSTGIPFKDISRVGKDDKCPQGLRACNPQASLENTICVPEYNEMILCPINELQILHEPIGDEDTQN